MRYEMTTMHATNGPQLAALAAHLEERGQQGWRLINASAVSPAKLVVDTYFFWEKEADR